MDTNRSITYRGFLLNDPEIPDDYEPGDGIGSGLAGCSIQTVDYTDLEIVQYTEKRAQRDGMDAGDVFLSRRNIHMTGTIYARSRPAMFDALADLRAALSPTLAFRESLPDKGYLPLLFSVPTTRVAYTDDNFEIALRALAMPRQLSYQLGKATQGGDDRKPLAVPFQCIFTMKDPSLMAQVQNIIPAADDVATNTTNRGNYHVPFYATFRVNEDAGTITIGFGGATLVVTVPGGGDGADRTIELNGDNETILLTENGTTTLAYSMLASNVGMLAWPLVQAGTTPVNVAYSGVTLLGGADDNKLWYFETYA